MKERREQKGEKKKNRGKGEEKKLKKEQFKTSRNVKGGQGGLFCFVSFDKDCFS